MFVGIYIILETGRLVLYPDLRIVRQRRNPIFIMQTKNRALTLMEILVSLSILGLVMVGMLNIFVAAKRYMYSSRSKMSGGELGKFFLDNLKIQVDASQWAANCLGTGTPANCLSQTRGRIDGLDRDYTATYAVVPNTPSGTSISQVRVDITWPREQ